MNQYVHYRDRGKIDFFNFLSIRPILSIIDKTLHLSIKNRFCQEERTNGGIGNRNSKKAKSVRFCICKKGKLVSFRSGSPAYLLQMCFWNFGFKIKIWKPVLREWGGGRWPAKQNITFFREIGNKFQFLGFFLKQT